MSLISIIIYISILVWLAVPIRQYGTRYFIFFLILSLFDPIFISVYYIFKPNISILYLLGTNLLLYSALIGIRKLSKLFITMIFLTISIAVIIYSKKEITVIELIIHLVIFFNFLRIMILEFTVKRFVS